MTDYAAEIDKVIRRGKHSSLKCPYCNKQLKSTSGFTLHQPKCDKVKDCKAAAKKLKLKAVQYQGEQTRILHIKDGLVVITGGYVVPASKIRPAMKLATKTKASAYPPPRSIKEWLDDKCERWAGRGVTDYEDLRRAVNGLHKSTSYAKYRKWTLDDIYAELDKRFGKSKPEPEPKKRKKNE